MRARDVSSSLQVLWHSYVLKCHAVDSLHTKECDMVVTPLTLNCIYSNLERHIGNLEACTKFADCM
jgi:hypothetical protein